jgi:flagella basal body P-ring formation protein FlgA
MIGFLKIAVCAAALLWLSAALAPMRADAAIAARRAADILPAIEQALAARGVAPGFEIALDDPEAVYFADAAAPPIFTDVAVDEKGGRFAVGVRGDGSEPLVIRGRFAPAERVPAPWREIARGRRIEAADIVWIAPPQSADDFVRSDADLVGKEARRALVAGAPVRAADLVAPILVRKGAGVTMLYEVGGLKATHLGVALKSGAAGDAIEVRNAKSEQIVKAVVVAENLAAVASPQTALKPAHRESSR